MTGSQTNTVHGRVIYLLVLVIINQFAYPITACGGIYLIIYQILYASMFVAGIYVASDTRRHLFITASTAVLLLVFAFWYALNPTQPWDIMATYVALIPFLAIVIYVLLRYMFLARSVDLDVIYAEEKIHENHRCTRLTLVLCDSRRAAAPHRFRLEHQT